MMSSTFSTPVTFNQNQSSPLLAGKQRPHSFDPRTLLKVQQKPLEAAYCEIHFEKNGLTKVLTLPKSELYYRDVAWLSQEYSSWATNEHESFIESNSLVLTSDQKGNLLVQYLLTKPKSKLNFLPEKISLTEWKPLENRLQVEKADKAFGFEEVQLVGRGGFSEVFIGRKKSTGQFVAVKRVEKGRMGGAKLEKDLILQEKTTMLKLHGPFLTNLIATFQTKTHFYFTMEFMPCGTLRQLLNRSRELTEDEIRHFISEIIAAVEFVHQAGYILRDLKTDNVLLDEKGHIYLCDMGLTGLGPKEGENLNYCCGTAEYMAPEMLARRGYTYSADYYSLGIIAYELADGLPPFCRLSREDSISERILHEKPRLKSKRSDAFKDFVYSLLAKDPKARLGSKNGIQDLISHEWMKNLDFHGIRKRKNTVPRSIIPLMKYFSKVPEAKQMNHSKNKYRRLEESVLNVPGFTLGTVESEGEIEALNEEISDDMNSKLLKTQTCSVKASWVSTRHASTITIPGQKLCFGSIVDEEVSPIEHDAVFTKQDLKPQINTCFYQTPKQNTQVLKKRT
eukprot:CAMPEP_0176424882 /NCGR_PEP_ID=MMETSP0127-20121128/11085_1 /TAXON_ID=938130 /ORGANISM="Platyophrya macrostoma, Strain WH" /LENGTH=564 /DNA_ID=CAMNT_0017805991 /DNA_START=8 /DNA_END=1702 /DNA_ORIENTATION=-